MSFTEFLSEMAVAEYGNLPSSDVLASRSKRSIATKFTQIKYPKKFFKMKKKFNAPLLMYKQKDSELYILGIFMKSEKDNSVDFNTIFEIHLEPTKLSGFKYKNVHNVALVNTVEKPVSYREHGIALDMYTFLVKNLKYTILGDTIQFFGARKLWARLSRHIDLIVDIVDINTKKVLEQDTEIQHGDLEHEFDERVWSRSNEKFHIRLILKDLKD